MRVLIASLVHLATAQDLVAPGGLARSGGRRDMRAGAGSFRTPSGPAVGFFVDGSSIEDLNGVYARLERAPACLRDADLVYKNDDSAWLLARAEAGGAAAWVFVLDCVDRFGDEYHGHARAPGEGGDFEHLYRPRRADGRSGLAAAGDGAVAAAVQDDAELPWLVRELPGQAFMEQAQVKYRRFRQAARESSARTFDDEKYAAGAPEPTPADAGDDEASGIPPAFAAPEPTEAPAPVDGSDEEADEQADDGSDEEPAADDEETCAQNATALADEGSRLRRAGKADDAEAALLAALALDPRSPSTLLELAKACLDRGDPAGALEALEDVLALDPRARGLDAWLVFAAAAERRLEELPAARAGCETVRVGPNHGPSKRAALRTDATCPRLVDRDGWLGGWTFDDRFSVDQDGRDLVVTRLPEMGVPMSHGWALDLEFVCCAQEALGDARRENTRNHYRVLRVPVDFATDAELKAAYRAASLAAHPDRGGSAAAFSAVALAHECLADAACRRDFDAGADVGVSLEDFRETVLKKYFPGRYPYEPFGAPHHRRRRSPRHERVAR